MPDDPNSLKREYRIDSSDSARPPATLDSEPFAYAQGLKPKPRVIESTTFTVLDQVITRGKNLPNAKMILKRVRYDDGTEVDTTVGEDNEQYRQHLLGVDKEDSGRVRNTRVHRPEAKPETTARVPSKPKGK